MLEIKLFFGEWEKVTKEQAKKFYDVFCERATNLISVEQIKQFNNNHIRGGRVLVNGTIETAEEQQERIFEYYKNDLIKTKEASRNIGLRFIVIEYVCSFPKIDPYFMAAIIKKDGIRILFDDSSISLQENKKKERKVANTAV